jgi:glucose/arabinose dehydrogenase
MYKSKNTLFIFQLISILIFLGSCHSKAQGKLDNLKLPPGFSINLFADDVPNARTMVIGDRGTLFVGTRQAGKIYALQDTNADGKADKRFTIANGLNMPNGIAFRNGSLYVAAVSQLIRFDAIEDHLEHPPQPVLLRDDLPIEEHHGWRYMAFGPDDRLYMAIGAPCNVCLEEDYAQIRSMKTDGSDEKVVARGIRNSVGFTWHPKTRQLWLTDNGRDMMGDDIPADEINIITKPEQHFGFPYCHGGAVPDPEFGKEKPCNHFSPPRLKLGAHVAPLGITFYTGKQFPKKYHQQFFVAEHGSWNRSKKVGYRIMFGEISDNTVVNYTPFITGWLQGQKAWGRPAYLLVLPDGSLLVSDDRAGAIYRITYGKILK